ncbi:MAG TPA: gliding motility-associated C-terminal domain-containing protein [Flavobacteriales bacterium]|nr:gliding motility-associated C-terminal domain-containing protein [Flavobacteriales bacterium]
MRNAITFLLMLLMNTGKAQPQHGFWAFGFGAGIDLSSGTPLSISTPLSTDEGCTSISDASGQLLFFTNGETVWDRNHSVMPNGTGLFGHFSTSQSALIVPFPEDPQRYYLFTAPSGAGIWSGQPNAAYSIVDMNANGGLGDVTTANVVLEGPVAEKLTATRHANGRDVWVLYHRWESDAYLAYLVTCQGVEGPVVSHVGRSVLANDDGSGDSYIGCMRLNRQGTRLAGAWTRMVVASPTEWLSRSYVDLLDFDNSSGLLSNPRTDSVGGSVQQFSQGYGVEFSPSGDMLYCSEGGLMNGIGYSTIRQYDLQTPDPMGTAIEVANEYLAFGTLQLAPDGRLYAARLNGSTHLSAISFPEVVGPGCGFVENAANTGSNPSTWGLPNHWDTYPEVEPIDLIAWRDTLLCNAGSGILIDASWTHPFHVPTYLWNTGETTPSILVTEAGMYTVEMQLPCSTVVDTVEVLVGGTPFTLGADRDVCDDAKVLLDVGDMPGEVWWSTGDTTRSITVEEAGIYTVWRTDSIGCTGRSSVVVTMRNCQCPLFLPNAFTPNGDGINDELLVGMDCTPTAFELELFDRWGHRVFHTDDPTFAWTGDGVPIGVFVLQLDYSWHAADGPRSVQRTGSVVLVR